MSYKINFDNNNFKPAAEVVEPLLKRWVLQFAIEFVTLKKFVEEIPYYGQELIALLNLEKWHSKDIAEEEVNNIIDHLQQQRLQVEEDDSTPIYNQYLIDNIILLKQLLSLTSLDIKLLLFTLFVKDFKALEEVTDKLGSDVSNRQLIDILSSLFCEPTCKISALLSVKSKLIATGVIELESDTRHVDRKLAFVSSRFANALVTQKLTVAEIIREFATVSTAPSLSLNDYAHVKHQLAVLHPYLGNALIKEQKGVNVFIYGPPGTGKTQLAKVLAETVGSQPKCLYEISPLDEDGEVRTGDARLKALSACQDFIQNNQAIVLIDEVEDIFNDTTLLSKSTASESKAWLTCYLEQNRLPTIWVSNSISGIDPALLRRFDFIFELDVPPEHYRKQIIERECGELVSKQTITELAAHVSLSPAVVCKASQVVQQLPDCNIDQRSSALKLVINNTLEAQGHHKLRRHASANLGQYNPNYINTDLNIVSMVDGLKQHSEGRLCLYGPPGTGKTAFGHYLAKQLNKKLLVKKASDLISMYVGGTEQNLSAAFEQATREGAILMLDEVDSFLQERKHANHSWEITAVNEMLTQMESFNGIFIASTNLMNNLDEASIRRFDVKVKFDYLTGEQAINMFNDYAQRLSLQRVIDTRGLTSLSSLTPGDFALIARRHKFSKMKTDVELLSALKGEMKLKGVNSVNKIGFIS